MTLWGAGIQIGLHQLDRSTQERIRTVDKTCAELHPVGMCGTLSARHGTICLCPF